MELTKERRIDVSTKKANELRAMSKRIRLNALDMALSTGQKGAHLGGSLSCVEILAVLYGEVLQIARFPGGQWVPERPDRFFPPGEWPGAVARWAQKSGGSAVSQEKCSQ